jgi:hypothetical protein
MVSGVCVGNDEVERCCLDSGWNQTYLGSQLKERKLVNAAQRCTFMIDRPSCLRSALAIWKAAQSSTVSSFSYSAGAVEAYRRVNPGRFLTGQWPAVISHGHNLTALILWLIQMIFAYLTFGFFFSLRPPSLPYHIRFLFYTSKWMTCSMALSELTSELLIRNKSSIDFLVFFFLFTVIHRCVAVWQNDRVEIIANDRAFFHRISIFHTAENSCLTQRATEPRLPTSLLLQRSD